MAPVNGTEWLWAVRRYARASLGGVFPGRWWPGSLRCLGQQGSGPRELEGSPEPDLGSLGAWGDHRSPQGCQVQKINWGNPGGLVIKGPQGLVMEMADELLWLLLLGSKCHHSGGF